MLRRLTIVPFEVVIAALLIAAGITGMLHFGVVDPIDMLLPNWEAFILNLISVLAGIFIISGISVNNRYIEQAGLLFLIGAITSRFILYGHFFGYGANFIQTGIFYSFVAVACTVRSNSLRNKQVMVRIKDTNGVSGRN